MHSNEFLLWCLFENFLSLFITYVEHVTIISLFVHHHVLSCFIYYLELVFDLKDHLLYMCEQYLLGRIPKACLLEPDSSFPPWVCIIQVLSIYFAIIRCSFSHCTIGHVHKWTCILAHYHVILLIEWAFEIDFIRTWLSAYYLYSVVATHFYTNMLNCLLFIPSLSDNSFLYKHAQVFVIYTVTW